MDADIDVLVNGGIPAYRAPESWQRSYSDAAIFTDRDCGLRHERNAPTYTSSMEAALRLVPVEHDWIVASVNGHVGGTPYACVGSEKEHFGATPVISLCIAALQATP